MEANDSPAEEPEVVHADGFRQDAGGDDRDPRHWWVRARCALQLLEVGLSVTQHETLATGARVLVITGDMIFCRASR